MDPVSLILILAAAFGSFWGGRRTSGKEVLELLQAKVEILEAANAEKDGIISALQGKLGVLESLVTQRAEVEAVHQEVLSVRSTVERIASKLEA